MQPPMAPLTVKWNLIAGSCAPDLLAAHDRETAAPGNAKVNRTAPGSESSLASLLNL